VSHRRLDRVKCKVFWKYLSRFIYQLHEIFNYYIIPIKIKPLKKRSNEIIIQYLTVVKDEPPFVGVWACPWMSDQMSNKCQK
jgi:hypothetical protein